MAEEKLIGEVTHFFGHINVAIIKLKDGELKIGDKIKFSGHHADFEQEVTSMQIEHQDIEKAKAGDEFGIKVDQKVREGTKVYLITE